MPEPKASHSSSRMSAYAALKSEAKRLRDRADALDEIAKELDGVLSESAEFTLWSLVMNQRHT